MLPSKPPQPDLTSPSQTPGPGSPSTPASAVAPTRPGGLPERRTPWLGAGIHVEGKVFSEGDLQIDGTVDGPVSVEGKKLTVGPTAQLNSEIVAREVVVYGRVKGNVRAGDRVEIRKDGSVNGNITTGRIMIEEGARFKGKIEIDRDKASAGMDLESVGAPAGTRAT
jgi:cytoskeletal protein CcmA (bactofilin family)